MRAGFQVMPLAVLVIFSVLLALAMQNCREAQLNKELAQQALRNIASEIRVNQKEVEEALAYNLTLIDSLKQNPARGITWKPALIRDSAWETAQASGAARYLDFSIISIVVEIHEIHEQYKRLVDINTQLTYEGNMRGTGLEDVFPAAGRAACTVPMRGDRISLAAGPVPATSRTRCGQFCRAPG